MLIQKFQVEGALHLESQFDKQSTCCISVAAIPLSQMALCSEHPAQLYMVAPG